MNKKTPKFHLSEMPREIYPADDQLGFRESRENTKLAQGILKSSKSILVEVTDLGNRLYKNGNKFILVDSHNVKVLYYIKWQDVYVNLINKQVSKINLHWRDRRIFESRNLSTHVFFDLLLPINGSIMTDYKQTEHGRNFWFKVIDESLNRKLNVLVVNFLQTDQNNKNQIIPIKNRMDFHSLLISDGEGNSPWGRQQKFEARRIIISE